MTQAQFGNLVDLSRSTIQAIELKKLQLSERVAHRISEECDVAVNWLLENRLGEPLRTRRGDPWSLEWFQVARAGTWRGTYLLHKEPIMHLFRIHDQLRQIQANRKFFELVRDRFYLNLEKAVDDLWNTIPDAEKREELFRSYRKREYGDEEILKRVIAEARDLLAARHELKKRIAKTEKAKRPLKRKRPPRPIAAALD